MSCQHFLGWYSDYLDDRLDADGIARCRAHLEACASCARYDRVVRSGTRLLRELPDVEPSPDFRSRLQHRIFHIDDELRAAARGYGPGTAATLTVAAALALLAWAPALRTPAAPAEQTTIASTTDAEPRGSVEAVAQAAPAEPAAGSAAPATFTEAAAAGGVIRLAAEADDATSSAEEPSWIAAGSGAGPRLVPISSARPLVDWAEPRYSPLVVPSPAYRLVGGTVGEAAARRLTGGSSAVVWPARLEAVPPIIIE